MSGPVSGTCLSIGSDVNAELIRWAPASNVPLRSDSRLRLLCFPFAGAGTAIFREWGGQLPEEIQVIPIQLPGRENRWTEPAYRELDSLTRKLASVLRPLFAKPYALFGHSMGGIICFELTRQLRREKIPLPAHLFISGTRAPHIPDREPPLHGLSDAAFLAGLEGAAGGLDSALSNRDLAPVLLPILRADFTLCETYDPVPEPPFGVPISVYGGRHDRKITYNDLLSWSIYTRRAFKLQILPGDHFFLTRRRDSFLRTLSQDLSALLRHTSE